jgi:hypothetical protein
MLDTTQSAQDLNSSAHTQNSPPNSRIFHKGLGSHKEGLRDLKRLLKGYTNGQELATHERGGGVLFIGIWKTSHWSCQGRSVKLVGWLQIGSGNSLMKTLSDDKFGLGPGHVQRRVRQVRWSSNFNGHIVYRTCLVQDRTCPENVSGIR